jgi:magnesium transporter
VCKLSSEKAEDYFRQGAAYLLYRLVNGLLMGISDMFDDVNNELDEIEDLVFDTKDSDSQRIGKLRQQIVRLARVIGPKRLILRDLTEQVDGFSGKNVAKYYANNTKLVNKLWEEIDEARETVEVYKDADFTASTEQTNLTLAVLTLIFTFTIPVTVFASLYGMNVLLPGGIETGSWAFLGRYTTFGIVLALSVASAFGMFVYFKRKKWF